MAEVKIDEPKKPEGPVLDRRQPVDIIREAVFNEVIYGLGVLHAASKAGDYPGVRGILFALDYVQAMKDAEA
jgi:hypothetical protein